MSVETITTALRDVRVQLRQLARLDAYLTAADPLQGAQLEFTVSVKLKNPDAYDRPHVNHAEINRAITQLFKPSLRDVADLAGDALRTRERELAEKLLVAAAKLATGHPDV